MDYEIQFNRSKALFQWTTLREKCLYSELFWSLFSRIRTEYGRYGVTLRIQSECRKMRTGITPNTDTFHAVLYNTKMDAFLWVFSVIIYILPSTIITCMLIRDFFLVIRLKLDKCRSILDCQHLVTEIITTWTFNSNGYCA